MYLDKLMKTDKQTPESFWANTSGNDIIYRYVKEASSKMREEFDILASGGVIEKTIKDNITYRELDQVNNIYSFLLFTGYLNGSREGNLPVDDSKQGNQSDLYDDLP